jgi:uncharacterized metal-binding protein YceD (DUF177 family)
MNDAPAFSRPVRVDALPNQPLARAVEADAEERAALAKLCRLPAIAKLAGTFALRRLGRDGARVTGVVRAEFTQVCVVSLEPFPATLEQEVDVRFAPPGETPEGRRGELVALDEEDPPDPIVDGVVDLGALAAEFFALALDPYPRKPGVAFAPPSGEGEAGSPFAALSRWPDRSRE